MNQKNILSHQPTHGDKIRNIVKTLCLPLLLTLTLSFTSPKNSSAQKFGFVQTQLFLSQEEHDVLVMQHQYFVLQRQIGYFSPSYELGDLKARLADYNFPDSLLNMPLPLQRDKITNYLSENKVAAKTGLSFAFLRDDGIFLITMLHAEQKLQKLQNLTDSTLNETIKFVGEVCLQNSDIADYHSERLNIFGALKDTKKKDDPKLLARKKELETKMRALINKRTATMQGLLNKMEEACAGARDLVVIIASLQKYLQTGIAYSPPLQEKEILKQDYAISKDLYNRLFALYKKTFVTEVEMWHVKL